MKRRRVAKAPARRPITRAEDQGAPFSVSCSWNGVSEGGGEGEIELIILTARKSMTEAPRMMTLPTRSRVRIRWRKVWLTEGCFGWKKRKTDAKVRLPQGRLT
jgi:hypothetical protein